MSIEEMKNVDVRTVKREELADIREVEVNKRKSREGQIKDYMYHRSEEHTSELQSH